jgi:Fur family zinc uptake transcriptional regulator
VKAGKSAEKDDRMTAQGTTAHDHQHCIDDALVRASTICAQSGGRLTPLRRRVLELVWHSHAPVGAYDILDALRRDGRPAAPPTAYRALEFLLDHGLIHRIESLNAFVGCAQPERPHLGQFLICSKCSDVTELDDRRVFDVVEASARAAGFSVDRVTIELRGTCPVCKAA